MRNPELVAGWGEWKLSSWEQSIQLDFWSFIAKFIVLTVL